jgi:para-aminobenzoate synthetase component 1
MKEPGLPLVEELPGGVDAWGAFLRCAHLPGVLYLDSALEDRSLSRFSFLAADPFETIRWRHGDPGDPFGILQERLREYREAAGPRPGGGPGPDGRLRALPPFRGGAAGLFGYGLSRVVEDLPPFVHDEFQVPDLAVGLYDLVLAFDHSSRRGWIISQGFPFREPQARLRRAAARLEEARGWLGARTPAPREADRRAAGRRAAPPLSRGELAPLHEIPGHPGVHSDFSRDGFERAVAQGIEYVHAGDVFQVNLAQRLVAPAAAGPVEFYARLRERNPAPFAGYLDLGELVVASASPERFLRVDGDRVETRPIKGTRPRGRTPEDDRFARDELRQSAKDQAENVMIVDLLRNDLSRVCRPSTVVVEDLFRVETYETVHHLVSEVSGRLREGLGPIDLLRASFPGGSVTGAPKVRAMEIIAELEPVARGAYCGSLAYLGFDGAMDSSILIRTVTAGRGWLQFPVGGGIVARSDPAKEYAETLDKAEGILRALE